MMVMNFRTFIIKVLVFTISNPLSIKNGDRHSTTDIPYKNILFNSYKNKYSNIF